jgi:hypothetical protein
VAFVEVVKIDGIELDRGGEAGTLGVAAFFESLQGIVGKPGEVVVFEVVNEYGHAVGEALLYHLAEYVPGLPGAGVTHDEGAAIDVYEIDITVAYLVAEGIPGFDVDAIGIF